MSTVPTVHLAQVEDRAPLPFERIAYSKADASAAIGLSVDVIEQAVRAKKLVVHYWGGKPIFRAVDLDAFVQSLPHHSTRGTGVR